MIEATEQAIIPDITTGSELRLVVIVFLSVQHRVVVAGKMGPLHSHSSSIEAEISPAPGRTIPFSEVEAEIKAQIAPFEGKVLNELSNFQGINPTFENLAAHLYNRLSGIVAEYGAILQSLTVRESPTRAVKCIRNPRQGENLIPGFEIWQDDMKVANYHNSDQYLASVREARSRVGDVPFSPNQRASEDFDRVEEPVEEPKEEKPPEPPLEVPVETPPTKAEEEPSIVPELVGVEIPPPEPIQKSELAGKRRADRHRFESRRASSRERQGWWVLLTLLILVGATAGVYRGVLWPPSDQGYPWGSDTWGHIKKAEFLLTEIKEGNYYPNFTPMWYNGVEPFRYWAPLPYYALAGLINLLGDPFLAAGWYVAVCAFLGAAGWLLMKDRLGLFHAALAGLGWLLWQDNVRVAMSEGNLPRVLAAAFLPYLLHCFLLVVEKPGKGWSLRFGVLALVSGIAIVAHAMIAATYFVTFTLVSIVWLMWVGPRVGDVLRGVLGIVAGIGLGAWWLIPSLQDGITSIDRQAISEAMQFFPIRVSMDPYLRLSNPEIFYWGLSLLAVVFAIAITWKHRTKLTKAALIIGVIFVSFSTPTVRPLYRSIPFHHLVFPLYLATAASGVFFLAAFGWTDPEEGNKKAATFRKAASLALFLILFMDSFMSTGLIATRSEPSYLAELAHHMSPGGWREATLDLSRFGSPATYMLAEPPGRELVYGWAWQGATTGSNIVNLNTAVENEAYPYLFDRLVELGATHIVARRDILQEDRFLEAAASLGYSEDWRSSEAILLSAEGDQYALITKYSGIAIGRGATNWAEMFPSLAVGSTRTLDSYTYAELSAYPIIVISGANWADRTKAESLLIDLVQTGRRVIVDLEGLPVDVLSNRPFLLGVTGEPTMLYKSPTIYRPGDSLPHGEVRPFDETVYPWKALSPQGVDNILLEFDYLGEKVTALGSKGYGSGTVFFVGANLPYHAYLTGDPYVEGILSSLLNSELGALPQRTKVPFLSYESGAQGYSFSLRMEGTASRRITIPVASRKNMEVVVDGETREHRQLHNLITVDMEPGLHSVEIRPYDPPSLALGLQISGGFGLLLLLLLAVEVAGIFNRGRKTSKSKGKGQVVTA